MKRLLFLFLILPGLGFSQSAKPVRALHFVTIPGNDTVDVVALKAHDTLAVLRVNIDTLMAHLGIDQTARDTNTTQRRNIDTLLAHLGIDRAVRDSITVHRAILAALLDSAVALQDSIAYHRHRLDSLEAQQNRMRGSYWDVTNLSRQGAIFQRRKLGNDGYVLNWSWRRIGIEC